MTPLRFDVRSRVTAVLAAGVVAVIGLAAPAAAQLGLPDSVISPSSASLSTEQKQQITQYIDTHKAGLAGDPDAISRSRRAILAPLRAREVGTSFRIEYSTQLAPILRPLLAGEKDDAAINATRIFGELATKEGMSGLSVAIKDKRPAVRLVGAMGYERTFAVASSSQPAIVARDAMGALGELQTMLQAETDPSVADAIVIALDRAIRSDATRLPGVKAEAIKSLSSGISAKARETNALTFAAALARATDSMFNVVKDQILVQKEWLPDIAGVAGDMLALGVRTDAASLNPEQAAQMRQILAQAENVYLFSRQKAEGATPPSPRVSDSFSADVPRFRRDALAAIAVLTKRDGAFNLSGERFPTK